MRSNITGRRNLEEWHMKTFWHFLMAMQLVGLSLSFSASAVVTFSYSGSPFTVPDGTPSGNWSSVTVSGQQQTLTHLTATLNLSGGYNGDLYAYLSYDGHSVPLLNRIGVSSSNPFGSNGAGMNISLSDGAAGNVHAAGNGFLNGNYRPDGQTVSPLSSPGAFDPNGGSITLDGTFGGLNPNGVWDLFIADVVAGDGPAMVNGWSLSVTSVPEPGAVALAGLGLFLWGGRRAGRGMGKKSRS
jgi:hypothetical protein